MAVLHPATTELKNPKSCSNDEVTGMVLSTSHKLRGNARQGSEREMKNQTNSELVSLFTCGYASATTGGRTASTGSKGMFSHQNQPAQVHSH